MSNRVEHVSFGNPCASCGLPAERHRTRSRKRPEHEPEGDPCSKCHEPAGSHRKRKRPGRFKVPTARLFVGIDGEGMGRAPHRYTLLCAASERGEEWYTESQEGLGTARCLDFILSLPPEVTIVAYSFGYDLTKILAELPEGAIYRLLHEETRAKTINGKTAYKAVKWEGYRLNYMNGRLTVSRDGESRVIWDIFKFYQCPFVKALQDWGVAEELASMSEMKSLRAEFDKIDPVKIRRYSLEECLYLSQLARKLKTAHDDAGLSLTDYYGPGSTATAMFKKHEVKRFMASPPDSMFNAVACAFSGGWFEIARQGRIEGPVYEADLSSAYPYQLTRLPCLACGTWEWHDSTRGLSEARLALCHWKELKLNPSRAWGTLPVRTRDGAIIHPYQAPEGWAWKEETFAAFDMAPGSFGIDGYWGYHTDCDHRPFWFIPEYYLERIKLGKEGKGKVFKLGPNSAYGKCAQTKGRNPQYQNFIWAGVITSSTRGLLLRAIASNPSAVCMVATDGIYSTLPLVLPNPEDTGTGHTGKPLGGWESKVYDKGLFIARPGVYFPLDSGDASKVKARGINRAILAGQTGAMIEAFESGAPSYTVTGMTQFIGAKGAVHKNAQGFKRADNYGEWVDNPITVTFDPAPKRRPDMGLVSYDGPSEPYSKALESHARSMGVLEREEA